MEISQPAFEKYIFVCENERPDGRCCGRLGSEIRDLLKQIVRERGLARKIRVSRTGCLDVCQQGPNVLIMPDNIWYKQVTIHDVNRILDDALKGLSSHPKES
ncbi:MAG: ferredoxin [Candidatus Omnitrophica bacterium CG11_big_fil_rev_8_21_14_0_20_45_26]|uniref:Ferredoxin n=1 Tax=Candidatus Abzuiibacterium crystallinum TaxID=1974748 RepID=A0A2H0LP56_9BACT|nr:MAG: ferredoxin [Candidatus Omnitrophica bacterium CG11_big_fil_rev_8_21_14_0_20_45_26]PIW64096.1 MAG: ferredoxin [Candidatus Omnitrophica bacterium CG12_big_fil_rev_8_21_14_0_65_45_16]